MQGEKKEDGLAARLLLFFALDPSATRIRLHVQGTLHVQGSMHVLEPDARPGGYAAADCRLCFTTLDAELLAESRRGVLEECE